MHSVWIPDNDIWSSGFECQTKIEKQCVRIPDYTTRDDIAPVVVMFTMMLNMIFHVIHK